MQGSVFLYITVKSNIWLLTQTAHLDLLLNFTEPIRLQFVKWECRKLLLEHINPSLLSKLKTGILFEEVSVQRSIWGCLQGHLQHLHTFFQPGVSRAKTCGFKSLCKERRETPGLRQPDNKINKAASCDSSRAWQEELIIQKATGLNHCQQVSNLCVTCIYLAATL